MNSPVSNQKVKSDHLKKDAYLYIRQSTLRQVFENTESTLRQYDLRDRAVALGWPVERVIVIDSDLGRSGASSSGREGFQRLVGDVGMGRAGIVLGLEVSRLARNCSDWHRLIEICAITNTLILDEDGIYDPSDFNDRLLLGLKGTMSEAELHMLRARLHGGILNRARRGELRTPLPIGFVYDDYGKVGIDPDLQVQKSIHHLFQTFKRIGSATGVVKVFRNENLLFPSRPRVGPHKGELFWSSLKHWRVLQVLHNPRYAGAFFFGKSRTRKALNGKTIHKKLPREEWTTLVPDAHPGYITWKQYERNQKRLRENAQFYGADRRASPPREGPALLQGLVICGVCGKRMTIRYQTRSGNKYPIYVCQREGIETACRICQSIPGAGIDKAVGDLLVESITPVNLEVALRVQKELQTQIEESSRLRHLRVERAQYEVNLAKRRYMQVDPDNRLVADALEAEWNNKLRALSDAQEEYQRGLGSDQEVLNEAQHAKILQLATDFPRLWRDPRTPQRERKRMVRLMVEDATIHREQEIQVNLRFKGGAVTQLSIPLQQPAWRIRQTSPEVIKEIDHLLDEYVEREIAQILNKRGFLSGEGKPFSLARVRALRRDYNIKSRYQRLRETGLLTIKEMTKLLKVSSPTVRIWHRNGLLQGVVYNNKNEYLYKHPGDDPPVKKTGRKLSKRRIFSEVPSDRVNEVQYEV